MKTTEPIPDWVSKEIIATWRKASNGICHLETFKVLDRMVDRLGYGRTTDNPSLAVTPTDQKCK